MTWHGRGGANVDVPSAENRITRITSPVWMRARCYGRGGGGAICGSVLGMGTGIGELLFGALRGDPSGR